MRSFLINGLRKADDIVNQLGPIKVLFVVRNALGMFCLYPIIEEMKKQDGFKIALTLEKRDCYSPSADVENLFQDYEIDTHRAVNKKWHYVVTTDWTDLWFKRNTTIVYTLHGNAYGNLDKDSSSDFNYVKNLVLNCSHQLFLTNAQGDTDEFQYWINQLPEPSKKKCIITGLARSDKLVNSTSKDGETYLASLGLNPNNKTLVINSHWTEKSLFIAQGVNFIDDICRTYRDLNVLVMGHGNLWRNQEGALFRRMNEIAESHNNLRFLPGLTDSTGFLRSADFFIGDNSSVFIEYCIVDKPILFFNHPNFTFSDNFVGELYCQASTPFDSSEALMSSLRLIMSEGDNLQKPRQRVVNHFLSNLGNASIGIVSVLKRLAKNRHAKIPVESHSTLESAKSNAYVANT